MLVSKCTYSRRPMREAFCNNYRKMHGQPMKRRRQLKKARDRYIQHLRMKLTVIEACRSMANFSRPWALPDYDCLAVKPPREDWCSSLMTHAVYGQKVINQNAVCKIVFDGEEKEDECS